MGPNLLLTLALATPAQEPALGPVVESPRPPHVLFILIDTCRADRLGMYRDDRETTPFLSKLAEDGVVFEQCRAQAPWTKPSMASLLTSRYPSEVGISDMFHRLDDRWVLFPEVMQEGGYHTAGFSTNPLMGSLSNYIQGFDEFVESTAINRGDPIQFASGAAAKVRDRVVPWLETVDADTPQFLYVHVVDPHEEYEPAPEYLEVFADPARQPLFREEWQKLIKTRPPLPGLHVTPWNFEQAGVPQDAFIEHALNLYDADILACDAALADLYAAVTETWGEDVLLVLASDHGEEFMEHDGTSHGYCLYEELVNTPLLMHWPSRIEGRRVPDSVRNLDIFPTLMELCGLETPKGLRGRSLTPLLAGEALEPLPAFSELVEDSGSRSVGEPMGIMHMVVDGKWKLIRNLRNPVRIERPDLELYDLEADPREQTNLAAARPEVAGPLADLVEAWTAASLGLAASTVNSQDIDPEVLDQLAKLGYAGGDEADAGPSDGGKLPLLARAVLEGAERWTLVSLEPDEEVPEDTPQRKLVAGVLVHDRGRAREENRDKLLEALYRGLVAGVEPPEDAPFRPIYGIRAAHRGHICDVLCDYETRRVRVQLDGRDVADLATAKGAERIVREVFEAARVKFESF